MCSEFEVFPESLTPEASGDFTGEHTTVTLCIVCVITPGHPDKCCLKHLRVHRGTGSAHRNIVVTENKTFNIFSLPPFIT